jgi:hypothetical protein
MGQPGNMQVEGTYNLQVDAAYLPGYPINGVVAGLF